MTGPEHYAEAERSLAAMNGKPPMTVNVLLAEAQAHATLALAAATGLGGLAPRWRDADAWAKVASGAAQEHRDEATS